MEVSTIVDDLVNNQSKIYLLQSEISKRVATFQEQLNQALDYDRQLREAMLTALEQTEDPRAGYEDALIKVTYVKPSERTSVDTARMQFEHPDLFEKYKKTTQVKSSVRIKLKG